MKKIHPGCLLFMAAATALSARDDQPLLLQSPTLSRTQIAFGYGEDIWIVGREGGDAHRLVSGGGINFGPHFSPDGSMIAYTGDYDEHVEVYVVAAAGGEPRRLTYHAAPDYALGWSADGKSVLFCSPRDSYAGFDRLFTVPVTGGIPQPLPLPTGEQGALSPDGTHCAYVPYWNRGQGGGYAYIAIKQYRGGKTSPIWIADLADSSVAAIPRNNSNDFNPMWVGDALYFLSDRDGAVTLFRYDPKTRQVAELVKNDGFDLKSAGAGPGGIVYEQFGSLHLYDLATGATREIHVRAAGDMPQVRPHFERMSPDQIVDGKISPTGARALFEAHGNIFTVPAEKGDVRNLTPGPGVANRSPAWSPDGKWIAYFSDESGEYALHLIDQKGLTPVRVIDLGRPPSFFYQPVWSPDSRMIAYSDKRLNLWYVNVEPKGDSKTGPHADSGAVRPVPVKVDTDRFDTPHYRFDVAWSPDSRWLTYTKQLENRLHAVFVYSLADKRATQVTDGMSDALSPVFDKNGKQLYFTASTDVGLSAGWIDMTSEDHTVVRNVYLIVLGREQASPLAPESDEEKDPDSKPDTAAEAKPEAKAGAKPEAKAPPKLDASKPPEPGPIADAKPADENKAAAPKPAKKEPPVVTVDFDGIDQRILALPIPADNYLGLVAGKEGILYIIAGDPETGQEGPPPGANVRRFDLKTRKTEKILDRTTRFALSENGEKMLYEQDKRLFIVAADKAPKPGDGALKLDGMEVEVDPRADWRQMYREVWRIERDFFYDPHYHGLDLAAVGKVYAPFLDGIASRGDLNYLFSEMLGNMNVQHMFVFGGQSPHLDRVRIGMLGADYAVEHGRYRFARVYEGANWYPQLHAPLTQPGVNVKAGDYLLAVNGRPLHASDNLFSFFQETAGRQVVLKVGPDPDETGSRDVTVVPLENEGALRHLAWIEGNRRKVDQLSGGRLAYVYLPNTAAAGYTSFNRYYFAQVGKQGAILDERFNGGGQLADYIIDYLHRPLLSFIATREGETQTDPGEAIFGPKVMIINESAGSGGDAMPWYFRKTKVGPLVGTRTWGGLVGIGGYPELIDGGRVTAPRWAFYGLEGQWEIENHGVAPDYEVTYDPKLVREGHDPQLEKAVAVALDLLKAQPPSSYAKPAELNYHPRLPSPP